MSEAGLTPTEQASLHAPAATLDGTAPADVWRDLADALEPAIREAVRKLLSRDGPTHHADRADVLLEAGVSAETDAGAHALVSILAGYDRAPETDEHEDASALLRAFGQPGTAEPLGWHVPLSAVGDGPLALLGTVEATPTVVINLQDGFFDQRADQRRDICRILAMLSRVADVRLLATGRQQRKLKAMHRPDLPGVHEWCSDHRDSTPLEATVETALVDLDPEGRPVQLLRVLAAEPGAALAYRELYRKASDVDKSTVRRWLGRLADLGLIERFGPDAEKKADLLPAGREFLDALDAEHGQQATLRDIEERVSESGQRSIQTSGTRKVGRGEGSADSTTAEATTDDASKGYYRDRFLAPLDADAVAGTAESGAVTLVKDRLAGLPAGPDHRLFVKYDAGRAEGIVAVRASTALQATVSLANAFTSVKFLRNEELLDRLYDRLDPADAERLRKGRCIGWLDAESLEDPDRLTKRLVARRQEVEEMTRELKQERAEGEDTTARRSAILRDALGLVGTVMHLLDVVGVDVTAELRIPEKLPPERLEGLAASVAYLASINSEYDGCTAYRQLYEEREDKRRSALTPEVDATDATGRLLGGLVFRGPDVHRLRSHLDRALARGPTELHEDAPEFAVDVPVREAGREAIERTAERVLSRKRLRPTPAAVSVLHGLVGSPYDVVRALAALEREHLPRDIRPDELRYALATLDAEAFLPDVAKPTARRTVATLLRAERRLSSADLATRADVHRRSLRRLQDVLEALDVVDVTADAPEDGGGWRLKLSFRTEGERLDPRVPTPTRGDTTLADAVNEVAAALLAPEEYDDPGGIVHESLSWPPDPWALADDPRLEPWIRVAAALVGADPPIDERTVRMGPELEQEPLPTAAGPPTSAAD